MNSSHQPDSKTARELILNEASLNPALNAVQGSLFTAVFGSLSEEMSEISKQIALPLSAGISLVKEFYANDIYKNTSNKNIDTQFTNVTDKGTSVVEFSAVAITLCKIPYYLILGPILLVGLIGFRLLSSLSRTAYHGYQLYQTRNEPFSKKYEHHAKHFKKNAKSTFIMAMLGTSIAVSLFLPTVLGIAIAATVTLGIKIAVDSLLGINVLKTLVTPVSNLAKKIGNWMTDTFSFAKSCSAAANKYLAKPINKFFSRIGKKVGVESIPEPKLPHALNKPEDEVHYAATGKFETIDHNVDDLLRKMDAFHNSDAARNFLISIIQQEQDRIFVGGKSPQKLLALSTLVDTLCKFDSSNEFDQLSVYQINPSKPSSKIYIDSKTINKQNPLLPRLQDQTNSKDTAVQDLFKELQKRALHEKVFESNLQSVGGMQKVFVLADHYLKNILKAAPAVNQFNDNDDALTVTTDTTESTNTSLNTSFDHRDSTSSIYEEGSNAKNIEETPDAKSNPTAISKQGLNFKGRMFAIKEQLHAETSLTNSRRPGF